MRTSATAFAFAGQDREAIAHAQEAIRLSPLDPMMALFLGSIAVAHYTAGRYAEAVEYTTQARGCVRAFKARTACVARASRRPDASRKRAPILRPCGASSRELSLDWIRANVPYQTPELMERFLDGMRKAGLE